MIFKNTLFLSSLLLLCLLVCFDAENLPTQLYSCSKDTAYNVNNTSGRAYRNNLESLLSDLSSNTSNPNGFYNSSAGTASSTVNGLFLCRADVTPSDCKACVANATAEVLNLCPNQTGAVTWYDSCMLRYSYNQSIFSSIDTDGGWCLCNPQNVSSASDTALLDEVLKSNSLVNQIARRAAYVHVAGGKRFGIYGAKYHGGQMVYTLGQCYPGLLDRDCESCLMNAISSTSTPACCYNHRGGRTVYPSCNFRYELYQFYQGVAPPAPPPSLALRLSPAPPPPRPSPTRPSARNSDAGGISTKTTLAIVVPTLVSISVIVVVFCVARKAKKRKPDDAIDNATGESSTSTDHVEFLRYKFSQVEACKSNFSAENIIGRGGFGPVYKGTFPNGQIVAVKRLSKSSKQGGGEFLNEIALVAKL